MLTSLDLHYCLERAWRFREWHWREFFPPTARVLIENQSADGNRLERVESTAADFSAVAATHRSGRDRYESCFHIASNAGLVRLALSMSGGLKLSTTTLESTLQ